MNLLFPSKDSCNRANQIILVQVFFLQFHCHELKNDFREITTASSPYDFEIFGNNFEKFLKMH